MTIRIVDGYLKEYIHYADGEDKLNRHLWDGRTIFSYQQYLQARRIRQRYLDEWVYLGGHKWKLLKKGKDKTERYMMEKHIKRYIDNDDY